jgi:hypothetical protein
VATEIQKSSARKAGRIVSENVTARGELPARLLQHPRVWMVPLQNILSSIAEQSGQAKQSVRSLLSLNTFTFWNSCPSGSLAEIGSKGYRVGIIGEET